MAINNTEAIIKTLATVSNITDIVFKVMRDVSGNDIASTINGTKVSTGVLAGLIQNRIKENLSKR
jgi:uncharacterized membrane protein YcjF (UPF0283 family)